VIHFDALKCGKNYMDLLDIDDVLPRKSPWTKGSSLKE
jgi:hypothetical protein